MQSHEILRRALVVAGVEPAVLAARCDITLASVHRYLDGTSDPSATRMRRMLEQLAHPQHDPQRWSEAAMDVARMVPASTPPALRQRLVAARYRQLESA